MASVYHVAKTGNDGNTGTQTLPWKTIAKASNMLQAGDTVYIHSGEYQEVISPVRSGTSSSPITYAVYPGDVAKIVGESLSKPGCCIAIGFVPSEGFDSDGDRISIGYEGPPRSYIIIDGLDVSYKWSDDPSMKNLWEKNEGRASFIRIENYASVGNVVRNCKIYQTGDAKTNFMSDIRLSGIGYGGSKVLIENNEIYGMWLGIWLIGPAPRNVVIRKNTIHDAGSSCIDIGAPLSQLYQHTLIEENVLGPTINEDGIQFEPDYDQVRNPYWIPSNRGVIIRKNTFRYCAENSIDLKGAGNVLIEDNIVYGSPGQDDGGIKLDYRDGQYKTGTQTYAQDKNADGTWKVEIAENRGGGQGFICLGAGNISSDIIVRNNIVYDNMSTLQMYQRFKVYNNTFVGNNRDFTGPNSTWNPAQVGFLGMLSYGAADYTLSELIKAAGLPPLVFEGGVVINNIFSEHKNGEGAYNVYRLNDGLSVDNNVYSNSNGGPKFRDPGANAWLYYSFTDWKSRLNSSSVIGKEKNSKVLSNIGFVNVPTLPVGEYGMFDFTLLPSSLAKRAGTSLTKTTSAGNGTTIPVLDAHMFSDGYEFMPGDMILVGANSPVRVINSTNKNALVVNTSIAWSSGDGISIERLGLTPDAGAMLSTSPAPPNVAPTITSQPQGQSIAVGQSATFQVTATGTAPLSYQWKKNGSNISGATSSTYTLQNAVIGDDASTFTCTVSNVIGTTNSSPATLSVADITDTFQITQHPSNVTTSIGGTATFSVVATSDNVNNITYQWYKNNVILSGEIQNTLTLISVVSDDNNSKLKCDISYSGTTLTSNEATLIVLGGVGPLTIVVQPTSQTKNVGDTVTFSVTISDPSSQVTGYQWYKNGVAVGGATPQNFFTMTNLTLADTNAKIKAAILYDDGVHPLPTGTLAINTTNLPYNGGYIILNWTTLNATHAVIDNDIGVVELISGNTVPIFVTSSKTYTLTLTSPYGTKTYSVSVNVAAQIPFSITVQPTAISVVEGNAANFSVDATSQIPGNITYQWYVNDSPATNATSKQYNIPVTAIGYNNWKIKCSVSYQGTTITSNEVTLTVTNVPVQTLPSGVFNINTFTLPAGGGYILLSWTTQNTTNASIDNGVGVAEIPNGQTVPFFVSKSTSFTLTLSNQYGTKTYTESVTVDSPTAFRFTTQPTDSTVYTGGNAVFSAEATSEYPLNITYQWYDVDNRPIRNETSKTITFSNVQPFDNGTKVKCKASYNGQTIESNTVTMFVTDTPTSLNIIRNGSFINGTNEWNIWNPAYIGFDVINNGTTNFGRISILGEGSNMQFNQSGISLKPATQYTISFNVYAPTESDCSVSMIQNGTPYANVGLSEDLGITGNNQRFTYTFTTNSNYTVDNLSDCRLMFWFVNYSTKGDVYYFSNMELKEIINTVDPKIM